METLKLFMSIIHSTLQQWWLVKFVETVFDKVLRFVIETLKTIALALFLCFLALVGAFVGTIIGAFNGHGTGISAIGGAVVALRLSNYTMSEYRYSLSKDAVMESLMDWKGMMNWPSNFSEYMHQEISDFVDESLAEKTCVEGMAMESIQELPVCEYDHSKMNNSISCSICLEDYEAGEIGRRLPNCDHFFHVDCIDQWLHLHGSCPICRKICI